MCSTSNEKAVTNLVKTLMGTDRLERIKIFAGDVVERKKPHPDIYNLAKVGGQGRAGQGKAYVNADDVFLRHRVHIMTVP